MQHGFWEDFSVVHFLDMRHKRNLIGHTDDLEGEDVIPLGTGIVQDLQSAIQRTLFPENTGPGEGGFMMSARAFRELEPSRPGQEAGTRQFDRDDPPRRPQPIRHTSSRPVGGQQDTDFSERYRNDEAERVLSSVRSENGAKQFQQTGLNPALKLISKDEVAGVW